MSVPQRLSRRLEQTLGSEAAEDLVNLLDGVELHRSELRAFREGLRAEFAEFRADAQKQTATSQQQMAALSAATQKQIAELSAATQKQIAELSAATQKQIAELSAATQKQGAELNTALTSGLEIVKGDIQKVRADLLLWSFVLFWVAAVGTIAGLAGVHR